MRRPVVVVYNAKSGSAIPRADLKSAFVESGLEPVLYPLRKGLDIQAEARKQKCDCVVAVGGDGTIRAVASQLVGTKLSLGVIPAGTLNHFAKDMQIPTDIVQAVAVIAAGHKRKIDVGQVNDVYFLNNSSVGVYPRMVKRREASRLPKWPAAALGLWRVLRDLKIYNLTITTKSESMTAPCTFVFAGNNSYRLDKKGFNNRTSLWGGSLSLYIIKNQGRGAMLQVFLRTLAGMKQDKNTFIAKSYEQFEMGLEPRAVSVAFDGEVADMTAPLRYRIVPKSLSVLVSGEIAGN